MADSKLQDLLITGDITQLAKDHKVTRVTVYRAVRYQSNTELSLIIRSSAFQMLCKRCVALQNFLAKNRYECKDQNNEIDAK